MFIVCYDELGTGGYRTIRKLIVVLVILNQAEMDIDFLAYRSFCRLKKATCCSMGHFAGWKFDV